MDISFSTILDLASKILTVTVAVGGLLAFAFRKWLTASIDAHFKRKVEAALAKEKHDFGLESDREKAKLIADGDRLRAELVRAQEDRNSEIARALQDRKGEITQGIEALKAGLKQTLETHIKMLERESRQFESTVKRTEDAYLAALQMGSTIDLDLRQRRIPTYEALWKQTSVLPRWSREQDITYEGLKKLSADMTSWYFETGGLYLSERSMRTYNELQNQIWQILNLPDTQLTAAVQSIGTQDLSSHYDLIRRKCSKLRTSLTNDILSRRGAPASSSKAKDDS